MKLPHISPSSLPAVILAACWALNATAQTPPAPPDPCVQTPTLAFEVASVHEMNDGSRGTSISSRPDQFAAKGATVRQLLLNAFDLREFQVAAGLPDWAASTRYEISARIDPPESPPATLGDADREAIHERMEQRLRALLKDRFALKCHIEMKEQPVYQLVVAKGGIKMAETKSDPAKRGFSSHGDGLLMHAVGTGLPTSRIAFLTSGEVGRLVIDKTGLTGDYDFTADWVHDSPSASPENTPSGPSFFTALEEQLGLKLVPAKAPVPMLVVDHIEHPTEN